jgi:anti-sigma B factor antagonist
VPIDGVTTVLELHGELDLVASPAIKRRIREVIDAGKRRLIIDLSDATFIDSTLLHVLAASWRALQRTGGDLTVLCKARPICRVLELTGMRSIVGVSASLDQALARLGGVAAV